MKLNDFLNLFKDGKLTSRSHMRNLILMAKSDGNLKPEEQLYLKKVAIRYGIDPKELSEIEQSMDEVKFSRPENDQDRFNQIYELVHMMVIDEEIDQKELALCIILAKKLGFKEETSEELVKIIAENVSQGKTRSEVREALTNIIT